jgi:putative colanic acid biosynthesis UDP-glucose lipid carrier transferase
MRSKKIDEEKISLGNAMNRRIGRLMHAQLSYLWSSFPPLLPTIILTPSMLVSAEGSPRLFRTQLSMAGILRICIDPAIIIGVLICATLLHGETFEGPYLILALIVFSLTFPGRPPVATTFVRLTREVILNWLVIVLLLIFIGYATRSIGAFPSEILIFWVIAAPLVLLVAHRLIPVTLYRVLAIEGVRRKAVIVGASDLGRKLAAHIIRTPMMGIEFLGFFDDRSNERLGSEIQRGVRGNTAQLAAFAKVNGIDLIYITLPMASQPRILKLLEELRDTTASIYFAPDIFLFDLIQARMDSIDGIPVVAVCETPFYGVNGLIKRLSDIFISFAILALIFPIMAGAAIGVKLSSPGPILFRQRRYGVDGKEIIVYKFRTMTVCEDGGEIKQATKDDQRITRFGAFLRRTSLDELPQFINVLQGRMSIVGPRPHAVAHNELYRKLISGYMVRHKVKPGITGWAQVNGLRGETETLDKMRKRIEYDLAYLRSWSLRLDLLIIIKTVLVVIRDKAAY